MLPGSPLIWLSAVSLIAVPVTYGVTKVRASTQIAAASKAAYMQGFDVARGQLSTATVVEATKTAEAIREAEAETPIPVDKQAIAELCKRRASCRERATVK